MSEENPASRPSLATFLRGKPATKPAPADTATDLPATEAETPQAESAETPQPTMPAATAQDLFNAPADNQAEAPATDDSTETAIATDIATDIDVDVDVDADSEVETGTDPAAGSPPTTLPTFIRSSGQAVASARPTPRWQWALVAALALLLAVQIVIADRARLAADAGTRPLVSALCAVLRCSLPAWHEPAAYTMLSREIRPVPGQPGVLQVQASFRNEARWAQAWPALRLSLSDADGRVIGRRTLQPADYLGSAADPQARLEPGQSAQVSFRLREPASATVAFSFEFQ
ncbi:DUF3426 domain-containing protein [Stenotrophomonas sp. SY1]|uniref:DUF3426 domain-containing protein n=1 Tax=Stenotrophomonas sp. SY1 TaxID=477235 RepID=UPI001E53B148|nr:DUF3426 domain-containing protein [Stenotrophomonas sp. SY1]MCD9088328.1 DUF3426 domain-containing protein [Stenotrophomonas sp. SY1]